MAANFLEHSFGAFIEKVSEGQIFTPTPTPEFLSKDFPSATRSRTEVLTKENLLGAKLLPLQFPGLSLPY